MNFTISTTRKQEIIDITGKVDEIVRKSKIKIGLCHVFVRHSTASIIINENYDPNICVDFLNALNKAFPDKSNYLHDQVDGNAGAHIKAAILGPGKTVPIKNGKLQLGKWQSIMLVELDGPRTNREIEVNVLKIS
jgi:secondary thiamine-phosphate synthase enzyme